MPFRKYTYSSSQGHTVLWPATSSLCCRDTDASLPTPGDAPSDPSALRFFRWWWRFVGATTVATVWMTTIGSMAPPTELGAVQPINSSTGASPNRCADSSGSASSSSAGSPSTSASGAIDGAGVGAGATQPGAIISPSNWKSSGAQHSWYSSVVGDSSSMVPYSVSGSALDGTSICSGDAFNSSASSSVDSMGSAGDSSVPGSSPTGHITVMVGVIAIWIGEAPSPAVGTASTHSSSGRLGESSIPPSSGGKSSVMLPTVFSGSSVMTVDIIVSWSIWWWGLQLRDSGAVAKSSVSWCAAALEMPVRFWLMDVVGE